MLRKVFTGVSSVIIGLVLGIVIWGAGIEPRFLLDVQDETAEMDRLPEQWDGERVALLADLQVGMWWDNTRMIRKVVRETIAQEPRLVLIGGDFVYKPDSATVREAVSLVQPLAEAGLATYAVLGNHDYSMDSEKANAKRDIARYLAEQLEGAGISVLENEAITLDDAQNPLYLVGVGSHWAGESDWRQALDAIPDTSSRIVLMHNPVAFREMPAHSAPLALAGHTHGGQVRVPLTPSASWLSVAKPREVIADGWAQKNVGAEGNRAYVNRGIGFSLVPMRVRCRPELTLLTLTRRQSESTVPDEAKPQAPGSAASDEGTGSAG